MWDNSLPISVSVKYVSVCTRMRWREIGNISKLFDEMIKTNLCKLKILSGNNCRCLFIFFLRMKETKTIDTHTHARHVKRKTEKCHVHQLSCLCSFSNDLMQKFVTLKILYNAPMRNFIYNLYYKRWVDSLSFTHWVNLNALMWCKCVCLFC